MVVNGRTKSGLLFLLAVAMALVAFTVGYAMARPAEASCTPVKVGALPYTPSGTSWTADDCDSERREDSKADYYTFSVEELQETTITLTSAESGALYLSKGSDGKGELVESEKHDGFQRSVVTIQSNLGPGKYTVEATTVSPEKTGDYTLAIEAVAPHASVVPDPTTIKFKPNEKWHTFSIESNVPVEVLANPAGASERLEIATTLPERTFCPPEANDDAQRSNGQKFYLAACAPGTGVIEVRNPKDDAVLAKYTVTVKGPNSGTYATLSPDPSKAAFKPNGRWSAFKVASDGDVEIKANPTDDLPILELTSSARAGDHCRDGAEIGDKADAGDGDIIYLMPCKAGKGAVNIYRKHDSKLLASYSIKVSDTPARASLVPDPGTVTFTADSQWQTFAVASNVDVEVVVNPPQSQHILEITSRASAGNHCKNGSEPEDDVDASDGDTIYLAACHQGTGTVHIYRKADNKLLTTYSVKATPDSQGECKTVSDFQAGRVTPGSVYVTWSNPSGGAPVVMRFVQIRVWDANRKVWRHKRNITEPPANVRLWHGDPGGVPYAYRMFTVCSNQIYSLPTRWIVVGDPPEGLVQGQSGEEMPTPTPTPNNDQNNRRTPTESETVDESPPSPR